MGVDARHELGQVAAFDAKRRVHVHLQTFDHAGQDGLGRRVQAARLLFEHGRGYGQHVGNLGVARQAAGHFVVFAVPGVVCAGVGGDPGQCLRAHGGGGVRARRDQGVDQAHFQRLRRAKQLALHQKRLRAQQAQVARHLGHAGGTGQEAQADFGHAKLNLAVLDGDAVVRNQRHLPAAAQRRAVEAADHGFAQSLDGAEGFLHALDARKHGWRVRGFEAHGGFEVGTGKKRRFSGLQHDPVDGVLVLHDALSQGDHIVLPLQAHGVDGRVGLVKGNDGDAPVQRVADVLHAQILSTMVAIPMPPPTHSVAMP